MAVRPLLLLLLMAPSISWARPLDKRVNRFLEHPHRTFKRHRVPAGFRIIALSNLAEYCAQLENPECLEKLARIGLDLAPHRKRDFHSVLRGDHGLYLTHLSIVLSAHQRGTGKLRYVPINRRIVRHLARRILASKDHHIPSYPSSSFRWPADQSATLFALYVFDQLNGTDFSPTPIRKWLSVMEEKSAKTSGLHPSEVSGGVKSGRYPRGCALSWSVRYMAAFAPAAARTLWQRYKADYMVDLGLLGFREWPPGVDRKADVDSGPIIWGIGAAATGFAIGASRALGDQKVFSRLLATSARVRSVAEQMGWKRWTRSILAAAIELNGTTIAPWYERGR